MSAVRLWAAAASVVLAILFIWVAVISFGPEEVVVPEASWQATKAPQGQTPQDILRARTDLQRWRAESGPSPQAQPSESAVGGGEFLETTPGVSDPQQLAQSWLQNRPQREDMLRDRGFVQGTSSVPYPEANVFEQPQGRDWRVQHNDQIRYGGGWLIFGVGLAIALFLLFRGRIPLVHGFTGQTIERFNSIERANHWMTASSFVVMALTGLIVLYGKPLLLPLFGQDAVASIARWSAWLHMAFAVPFVLGILVMIVIWIVDNIPDRYDWPWLKQFGGFLRDTPEHPPAGRFNAGQKLVFWGVVLSGLALLVSGLALMFPFYWFGYDGMQWAQLLHAAVGLLMIALIIGHIYIGSVGMVGAFDAMWSGQVDRNWLKEHHSVWYAELTGDRGEARRRRGRQQPAE